MLLAVDIGNTNVTVGLYDGKELRAVQRVNSHPVRTADYYGHKTELFLKNNRLDRSNIDGIVIASVVPQLTGPYVHMARTFCNLEPLIVTCELKLGLLVLVDNPAEVGADRLCNAVAAGTTYPHPGIVVDLGTATTFDVIDKGGNYIGGAIAPGLVTGASALFRKAAKLYRIDLDFPSQVIGKNTTGHMQSGILFGHLAMIEGIVRRIAAEMNLPEIFVIATGGFSEVIASHSAVINATDPQLTLTGLRLIYEMNRRQK
ncbi:MAG: type III pantothenate kinase [Candidatus Neomarinimicrobiota bacterium]